MTIAACDDQDSVFDGSIRAEHRSDNNRNGVDDHDSRPGLVEMGIAADLAVMDASDLLTERASALGPTPLGRECISLHSTRFHRFFVSHPCTSLVISRW